MSEFTEEEKEQFEQELEDTSVKALLIEQNALLRDMHALMLQATTGEREVSESEPQYECVRCGDTVSEGMKRTHAEREHHAPPRVDLSNLFAEK